MIFFNSSKYFVALNFRSKNEVLKNLNFRAKNDLPMSQEVLIVSLNSAYFQLDKSYLALDFWATGVAPGETWFSFRLLGGVVDVTKSSTPDLDSRAKRNASS